MKQTEEIVQLVKCLIHKHKNQIPGKHSIVEWACKPVLESRDWKIQTHANPELQVQ